MQVRLIAAFFLTFLFGKSFVKLIHVLLNESYYSNYITKRIIVFRIPQTTLDKGLKLCTLLL